MFLRDYNIGVHLNEIWEQLISGLDFVQVAVGDTICFFAADNDVFDQKTCGGDWFDILKRIWSLPVQIIGLGFNG